MNGKVSSVKAFSTSRRMNVETFAPHPFTLGQAELFLFDLYYEKYLTPELIVFKTFC